MVRMIFGVGLFLSFLSARSPAQAPQKPAAPRRPTPTVANLAYGKHERQVLDFWQAQSKKPTPLVLYIHGGGWQAGDKKSLGPPPIQPYLNARISGAALHSRYVKQAPAPKIEPPVKAPLAD